jgi:dihydrodipicolinate synthase/N-acetylneuraminate lyase
MTPEALANPIVSLPSFFHRDGRPDLDSLRGTVEFSISNGFPTLLLTAGDSNYELQSETEIREVARAVVDQSDGRVAVVVGTALHRWRDQIVDFARFVDDLGGGAHFEDPI